MGNVYYHCGRLAAMARTATWEDSMKVCFIVIPCLLAGCNSTQNYGQYGYSYYPSASSSYYSSCNPYNYGTSTYGYSGSTYGYGASTLGYGNSNYGAVPPSYGYGGYGTSYGSGAHPYATGASPYSYGGSVASAGYLGGMSSTGSVGRSGNCQSDMHSARGRDFEAVQPGAMGGSC
jgi:hypothetical protein